MNPSSTDPAALPASADDIAADASPILSLSGSGYSLSVSRATAERKADLVAAAGTVAQVTNADESAAAMVHVRNLAAFRNEVEKARVEVKKPVLELGRKIDKAATDFIASVTSEEARIKKLVAKQAEEAAAAKRAAEAEERRKLDEARRAKEEAERAEREAEEARRKAAEAKSISAVIAAKQEAREAEVAAAKAAEEQRTARREQLAQSAEVAAAHVPSAVRFEPDFEVADIDLFYRQAPHLCTVTPKRGEIIAYLRKLHGEGLSETDLADRGAKVGLRVTLKPVVSTR